MSKRSVTLDEKEVSPAPKFDIAWPEELKIKPKHEFKISPNCTVLIYDGSQSEAVYVDGKQVTQDVRGFIWTIVNQEGKVVSKVMNPYNRHNDDGSEFCKTYLELMFAIKEAYFKLRPKKRTSTKTEVDEDDDY